MRFDLLDEYSTLVPFGFGVSRQNRVVRYPTVEVRAADNGAGGDLVSKPDLSRKLLGALRQMLSSGFRNFVAKSTSLF